MLAMKYDISNIPSLNIVNYDETNLTDDPRRRKVITKRGCKYPERVMKSSKIAPSTMYAAAADVVHKAKNLYNTWTEHGPKGCWYN